MNRLTTTGTSGDSRRIVSNSVTLIASRILTKIATTLLIIYVARSLGDERFGVFSSLLAFMALFSLIVEFGLTVPLIRKIAHGIHDPGEALGRVLTLKIPLSLMGFGLLVGSSFFFDIPISLALVFGISMVIEMLALSVTRSFEGFEKMKYVALITIVERTFFCALGFIVLFLGGSLFALAWVYVVTNLISLALGVYLFTKRFSGFRLSLPRDRVVPLLREAFPFFVATVFSVLYARADIFLLTTFSTTAEVGWYNAAVRIIDAQMFVPVAIVGSVFPVLSRYYVSEPRRFAEVYKSSFYVLLGLGIAVSLVTLFFADSIITYLYTAQFAKAIEPLKILSIMLSFYYVNFLVGNALIATGRERFATATLAIGALLNIVLNSVLIPRYGTHGAAWAKVVTEVAAFCIQFYLLVRVIGVRGGRAVAWSK